MVHGKPWLRRLLWAAAFVILLAVGSFAVLIWSGSTPAPMTASTPAERASLNLVVFDAVWDRLDRVYYDPTFGDVDVIALRREYRPAAHRAGSAIALYVEVLTPMLARLDRSHLVAFSPPGEVWPKGVSFRMPEARRGTNPWPLDAKDQAGHGMSVAWDGQSTVVDAVRAGSPAERLDIEPGSRIRLVTMRGTSRDRPDLESSGRFIVESEDAPPREVSMTWPRADPPARRAWRKLADGVTLIRFDEFDRPNIDWALPLIAGAGPEGVIMDLRANVGGSVREQNRLMAVILPPGLTTSIRLQRGRRQIIRTPSGGAPYTGPVAILIGLRTFSAAEGLAAAVQHHRRGPIVGQRSAGALLNSLTYPLPDGGRLDVPVRDVLAPDGRRIEGLGVSPDLEVRETLAAVRAGEDLAIMAAQQAMRPNEPLTKPRNSLGQ